LILLFLFGAHHLWRYGEARQMGTEAARFAVWERTVWEPSDNEVEKHALHKSDESLARSVVLNQLSTPEAVRATKDTNHDSSANSTSSETTPEQARKWLKGTLRTFVDAGQNPHELVSTSTTSGWVNPFQSTYRGRDPTLNTLTSLELDRNTYRTVLTTLHSNYKPNALMRFFQFDLPQLSLTRKMALITNTWNASAPLMRVRQARQLLPFSSGDPISGTKANPLAFFGVDGVSSVGKNFVGMVPWWNFLGGPDGLAGQYVNSQTGLDAVSAQKLISSNGANYGYDSLKPAESTLLASQLGVSEFFQPNLLSIGIHRHTHLQDKTAEAEEEKKDEEGENTIKARNSNEQKRKWMGMSLHPESETFFRE
jgi:hypothetical protein